MSNAAAWELLHDGSLERAEGSVPGDLSLFISIPYLRKAFEPEGDGFVLRLRGCTHFKLEANDGTLLEDPYHIALRSPELLSMLSEAPLAIYTTLGTLTLAYETMDLELDSGEPFSVESLDQASSAYWRAWSERHGREVSN